MKSKKKIIIDTDIGDDIDDAIALSMALGSPELDILGVTTVFGDVDTRTRIARKLVRAWGRRDIPTIAGFARPLGFEYNPGTAPEPCSQKLFVADDVEPLDRSKIAPGFIIECVRRYPKEVSVLTIGAMTNVAAALCMDPEVARQLAGIYSNIGYLLPSQKDPEWNARYDPLAVRVVALSKAPWTVMGVDVCNNIGLRQPELSQLAARDLTQTRALTELIVLYRKFKSNPQGNPQVNSIADVTGVWDSDADTVFALVSPGSIDFKRGWVDVDNAGHLGFREDIAGAHCFAGSVLPASCKEELMRRLLARS